LSALGVTEEEVENSLLTSYSTRVLNALRANTGPAILPLVDEMLEALAQSKCVRNSVAAETWFTAARVYSARRNFASAGAALTRAVISYPLLAIRIPWRGLRRVAQKVI
jgi:hypothetical protein